VGLPIKSMFGTALLVDLPASMAAASGNIEPATATAVISIRNDGTWTATGDPNSGSTWKLVGAVGDYDVRATITGGALTGTDSGTGTWLNLAATRSWGCFQLAVGSSFATLTIELSRAGLATVIESCTASISAEVFDDGGGP
jgi:hypothetical protein